MKGEAIFIYMKCVYVCSYRFSPFAFSILFSRVVTSLQIDFQLLMFSRQLQIIFHSTICCREGFNTFLSLLMWSGRRIFGWFNEYKSFGMRLFYIYANSFSNYIVFLLLVMERTHFILLFTFCIFFKKFQLLVAFSSFSLTSSCFCIFTTVSQFLVILFSFSPPGSPLPLTFLL